MTRRKRIMRCPYCGQNGSRVKETEGGKEKDQIERIRECECCYRKFKTIEVLESDYRSKEDKAKRFEALLDMVNVDFSKLEKELIKFRVLVESVGKEK